MTKRIAVLLSAVLCAAPAFSQSPQPQTATLHIYRYKHFEGSARRSTVYCDGTQFARIRNGHVFSTAITAGPHVCYSTNRRIGVSFTAEPGKSYYLRTDLPEDGWGFRLQYVAPEQGSFEIQSMKLQGDK